jgi:hypothetical protein
MAAVENYNSPFSNSINMTVFNSGLMVLNPSLRLFHDMLNRLPTINSYNGGDQGFLNEYFTSWKKLDIAYNVNKVMFKYDKEKLPPLRDIQVIHFVRTKPWYDIKDQVEINKSANLTDFVEDYQFLNDYWHRTRAWMYLSRQKQLSWVTYAFQLNKKNWCPNTEKWQQKHCVDVYPKTDIHLFESNKPEITWHPREITLTTQISYDRIWRLMELAREWNGPISVAIWVPAGRVLELFLELLRMPPPPRIDIHIVFQATHSPYPINLLRNVALEYAQTDMTFIIDADFIPSFDIYRQMSTSKRMDSIWEWSEQGHVFVIPAFEFDFSSTPCSSTHVSKPTRTKNCTTFPTTKADAAEMVKSKQLIPFHFPRKGHRATDNAWWTQTAQPYYIEWEHWYEPYVLVRRSQLWSRPFDERFVGKT